MFRDKTTFVIGAGASAEFDLPVGSQLAEKIRTTAQLAVQTSGIVNDRGQLFLELVGKKWPDIDITDCFLALKRIHAAIDTSVSIDAFIHRNREDKALVQMGKALIAWNIAEAEANSKMKPHGLPFVDERFDRSLLTDTWIGKFMRILFDGVTDPSNISEQVRIICFNYDRCIEYYLIESIHVAFNIGRKEAAEIVQKMDIIHPYGYLGKIPDDIETPKADELRFGQLPNARFPLREVAERIRTYTEQTNDSILINRIHASVDEAHNLVFLGFGFNNQNLDILRVAGLLDWMDNKPKNVFASAYGIDKEVQETLKRRITNIFHDFNPQSKSRYFEKINISFGNKCSNLFSIHDMNLNKFVRSGFNILQDGGGRDVVYSRVDKDDSSSWNI